MRKGKTLPMMVVRSPLWRCAMRDVRLNLHMEGEESHEVEGDKHGWDGLGGTGSKV